MSKVIEALKFVQYALACDRDGEKIIHPIHGELCLEEVKYCVVDPVIEELACDIHKVQCKLT